MNICSYITRCANTSMISTVLPLLYYYLRFSWNSKEEMNLFATPRLSSVSICDPQTSFSFHLRPPDFIQFPFATPKFQSASICDPQTSVVLVSTLYSAWMNFWKVYLIQNNSLQNFKRIFNASECIMVSYLDTITSTWHLLSPVTFIRDFLEIP